MSASSAKGSSATGTARQYWTGMARGAGGAIIFSLPMLMTMELWWLGFYAGRLKLALLLLLALPLLLGLSHYSGLRATAGWLGDAADAMSACGIGFVTSAAALLVFGVVDVAQPLPDIVGRIALEAVPAAFGAVLAQSQLGQQQGGGSGAGEKQRRKNEAGYWGQLFLMASGAIYLGLSVAPTQEMTLLAFKMNTPRAVVLALISLLLLHAFTYALEFSGQEQIPPETPWWSLFLRFTVVGYAMVLLLSAYILWTFGRFSGTGPAWIVTECVVLGFPASVGAAAARLIL